MILGLPIEVVKEDPNEVFEETPGMPEDLVQSMNVMSSQINLNE